MTGVRSIEALSLFFAAGIAVGTVLSGGLWQPYAAVFMVLAALPCLFPDSFPKSFWLSFLLLGVFCAVNAAAQGVDYLNPAEAFANECVTAMRELIGRIPFSDSLTAPILLAFLTGDRSALPEGVPEVFRASGASHLLALSGLHIGIIYLVFDKVMSLAGNSPWSRRIKFALTVPCAGFYTLMTGASASTVRAFLFIAVNEILRLSGRPRKASRVYCLALFIQLAVNPRVITGIGFQLSYLAMAGIFILYPVIDSWYGKGKGPMRWIWDSAAMSISCQVFTAPLVWLRFHTFPREFLLTNLMAIPLASSLIVSGSVTLALSAAGICPGFAIKITDGICRLLYSVLEIISS